MTPHPREERMPPPGIVAIAIEQAGYSPCRSKRGAVVFLDRGDRVEIHGRGHNHKPDGFACDGSASCKATCREEAVHAEEAALLRSGELRGHGCDILHVKSVDGVLVASGGPSCVKCSRLVLEAGIAGVWLYEASGWRRYGAHDFHDRSLEASPSPVSASAAPSQERMTLLHEACAFVAHYTVNGGCGHCGGLPHAKDCYVGRIARAIAADNDTQERRFPFGMNTEDHRPECDIRTSRDGWDANCTCGTNSADYWWQETLATRKLLVAAESQVQQLSTLQQQIDKMVSVLKPACDRSWEHETPIQVAHIAANAIHWRGVEVQRLQQERDKLRQRWTDAEVDALKQQATRAAFEACLQAMPSRTEVEEAIEDAFGEQRVVLRKVLRALEGTTP